VVITAIVAVFLDRRMLDRYLDSLERDPDLPKPRTIFADVAAPATDQLTEQLNRALGEIAAGQGPEGRLHFAIMSGRIALWEKVRGDPWSLHRVMRELKTLSERFPELHFSIDFEDWSDAPGGLRNGVYQGVPFQHLDDWISRFPRPDLSDRFSRCSLHYAGPPAARREIRGELQRLNPRRDGLRIGVADRSDGLEIVAEPDDPERAPFLLLLVNRLLVPMTMTDGVWECRVAFEGPITWSRTVSNLRPPAALQLLLSAGSGPVRRRVQSTSAPPLSLPRFDGVADLLAGEEVELRDPQGKYVRLTRDGTFARAGAPAAVESSDGRLAVTFQPGAPRSRLEWLDRQAGVARDVSARATELDRRPLGFVGHVLVMVESSLAIGHIRQWLVLHDTSGVERTSPAYTNSRCIAIDPEAGNVFLTAQTEGATRLLEIATASLQERVLYTFGDGEEEPRELIVTEGAGLLGVFSDREQTSFRRFDGERGFRSFATIPEMRDWETLVDGGFAYLITRVPPDSGGDARPSHLHEVCLADGAVKTLTPFGKSIVAERVARWTKQGPWIALVALSLETVYLFEAGALRRRFSLPSGHAISGMALSETGALALVVSEGDGADDGDVEGEADGDGDTDGASESFRLLLVRGEQEMDLAIPVELDPVRWVKAP
jgi:hypothetical protein